MSQPETGSEGIDSASAGPMSGVAAIRAALATMPGRPGVYRMLAADGTVLYVGKARHLRKRVTTYTQLTRLPVRLQRMVNETRQLEIITTHTESEALLLESNLIKRLVPRYNVQLRDDKSFPYVALFEDHDFPQIAKHRGARDRKGSYFGPFASAGAVNETLTALQRAFLLRSCADTVFSGRTRPCLLFQIKRCSAPCVGRISTGAYAALVNDAKAFLRGKSHDLQAELAARMQTASDTLDFEGAAMYRDRIKALSTIQNRQGINVEALEDADVVAAHQTAGCTCVQVFFFRGGFNYGNRSYFPRHDKQLDVAEVLNAFVGQFYADKPPPKLVLLSHDVPDRELLGEALTARAGTRVQVEVPTRGAKRQVVEHALANAREANARRLAESTAQGQLLQGVAGAFGLEAPPQRIEVYDNSHISGRQALGAMIVAGPEGFVKKAYRKFNIRGDIPPPGEIEPAPVPPAAAAAPLVAGGDDYAMMREVLTRRFSRMVKEEADAPDNAKWKRPDLILVDGGPGQLSVACQVFADLGVEDVTLVAISKGPDRDAGREHFYLPGKEPFRLDAKSPVLYYLQRLRDEAHRFVIGGHRKKRSAAIGANPLDEIAGVGAGRKRALLQHFGSARAVAGASLTDLSTVSGVSETLAKKIFDFFHPGGA